MKFLSFASAALIYLSVIACNRAQDCHRLLQQIENDLADGNFSNIRLLADSVRKSCPEEISLAVRADSITRIAERIALDFQVTENRIYDQLKERIGDFSPEEKASWEKRNWLEWRLIDGEKKYFNRAVSNLVRIINFHYNRTYTDSLNLSDPDLIFRREHTKSVAEASGGSFLPVLPVGMNISFTLTVDPDAVPPGDTVRCWMPFPKEGHPRQQNVKFISASHKDYLIAPDSAAHRTIYMEGIAEKGMPLFFNVSFSYQSSGHYFDPEKMKIRPYDKNSAIYREYTKEQHPHICFTRDVGSLADSIAGTEERPFEIVREIYHWIDSNIPWAGALEYSTIPDIPEYVLRNRRGDCGMQTFLLMSMLRYKGIPVRWQSGWMMPPDGKNLHDWCEVYFEGPGWVPVDMSYGLQLSENSKLREFYISGIDAYRLIVNDDVAAPLWPEKRFMRSEPYDFQRGEVEWKGGNLYFDKWDYNMKVEYSDDKARAISREYQLAEPI